MTPLLVIGYGNELRGDDGAGPRVAREVAEWNRADVCGVAVPQLTPELAPLLADAERVVFVDAAADGSVGWRRLQPAIGSAALGHTSDPSWLLELARELYGWMPAAWLTTIPAQNLDHGFTLSTIAQHRIEEALAEIADVVSVTPAR
jgi:hydrogenase maturation protease